VPGHGRVVGIPYGNQTAWYTDAAQFAKSRDRIGEVLQQLMGMNNVEGGVAESQAVDIADQQPEISHASGIG
jgi:hypothetical protein